MRSKASTWHRGMSGKSYWPLLRSLLSKRKYQWNYSPPHLVDGGLAPPPSKFYPGTKCYMIILTINNVEYYGFGPTPSIAKHFATFEAYNSLHPLLVEEVRQFQSRIPAYLVESADESDSDDQDTTPSVQCCHDSTNNHSDTDHESSSKHNDKSNGSEDESVSGCGPNESQSPSVQELFKRDTRHPSSHDTRHSPSHDTRHPPSHDTRHPPSHDIRHPPSHDTESGHFQSVPVDQEPHHPHLVWRHDERVVNKKRDVFADVEEIATRKGMNVSYKFRKYGPPYSRAVMCVAKAAGFQFTGKHFEKPLFAKCEAAVKLHAALSKLPDALEPVSQLSAPQLPPPPPQLPLSSVDVQSQYSPQYKSNSSKRSSANCPPNQIKSSSKPSWHHKITSSTCSLSFVSANPVGQLQELMLKEHLGMPIYSESVNSSGVYTEYTCIVTARELSAKGIGCSKKLAKRHAAENLLALMHTKHINIDPTAIKKNTKKPRQKPFRATSCPPRPHQYCPEYTDTCSPTINSLLPHPPGLHGYPYRPSYGSPIFPPQPYPPGPRTPPTYCIRGAFPPYVAQQPYCLPLPGVVSDRVHPLHAPTRTHPFLPQSNNHYMTESDSETDCESGNAKASLGLREMIPIQPTNKQALCGHDDNICPELTSKHDPQEPANKLSEIKSPFGAHSDPFHFTMRLPRERKVPWTNPGEMDAIGMSTKPPWCKMQRNSNTCSPVYSPPREMVPNSTMENTNAADTNTAGTGNVMSLEQVDNKSRLRDSPQNINNSPFYLLGAHPLGDSSPHPLGDSSPHLLGDSPPRSQGNQKTGSSPPQNRTIEGISPELGESSVSDLFVEEHPLVKEYKEKGMTKLDHDSQNIGTMAVECTCKTASHSKCRHVKKKGSFSCDFTSIATLECLDNLFDDDVHVCMPSEGTIAMVAK